MSTWDSTHTDLSSSTTSSASRFGLDENSTKDILVYRVRGGYSITNEKELCHELDKGGNSLRLTTKPIPRSQSRLNILSKDLMYDEEQKHAEEMRNPNSTSSVASVGLSPAMYLRRLLFGHFQQLYIVSQNSSRSLASSTDSAAYGSSNGTGENSPEDGPTRTGTGDVLAAEGR